jgi:hypothetical protein
VLIDDKLRGKKEELRRQNLFALNVESLTLSV